MTDVILPTTLGELLDILADDPEAIVYAGGTDIFVKMRQEIVNPWRLVCLERVDELRGVIDEGKRIWIGPAMTHASLLDHALIRRHLPLLGSAIERLASPPVRNMGTIGGNIVTASPAGDTLPALYLMDAELEVRSNGSSRMVPISAFIHGPGEVDLQPGEVLSGIRVIKPAEYTIHHFEKVGRRTSQACTVVSLAALLRVSQDGLIERARLAWGGVGPSVVTSKAVDEALLGKPLSIATLASVGPLAEAAVSPIDDVRAGADYRRAVAAALVLRLVRYTSAGAD